MKLKAGFQFTQVKLQDFIECKRRFLLAHVQELTWPAVQSEPVSEFERLMRLGAQFHRVIWQHQVGIPVEQISTTLSDPESLHWWQNYIHEFFEKQSMANHIRAKYPEILLSAPFGNYRLVARCDLVLSHANRFFSVIDWKVSRKRPRRKWLIDRMQTRVYPYMLVRSGQFMNYGEAISPDNVEMLYWFAEFPGQPERITYHQHQFHEDQQYLFGILDTILQLDEDEFTLTPNIKTCANCVYRSLCDRGIGAGDVSELELDDIIPDIADVDFDFDQIREISY